MLWGRKLNLKAKFGSGSSHFIFDQGPSESGRVKLGSTPGQPGVNTGSAWGQAGVKFQHGFQVAPPHLVLRGAFRRLGVVAQAEMESNIEAKMTAVYHVLLSSAYFQVLSTWASSVQPAPPHLDGTGAVLDVVVVRLLGRPLC